MNPDPPLPTRLKAGSPGLGQASQTDIERRASELALSDGRDAFTEADLARAEAELAGGTAPPAAPEADPSIEGLTSWDDTPSQAGRRVEPPPLEDENIAEHLIQQGIEEADHDLRVAAAKERTAEGGK